MTGMFSGKTLRALPSLARNSHKDPRDSAINLDEFRSDTRTPRTFVLRENFPLSLRVNPVDKESHAVVVVVVGYTTNPVDERMANTAERGDGNKDCAKTPPLVESRGYYIYLFFESGENSILICSVQNYIWSYIFNRLRKLITLMSGGIVPIPRCSQY